jgi:hypothetical protein
MPFAKIVKKLFASINVASGVLPHEIIYNMGKKNSCIAELFELWFNNSKHIYCE